MVKIKPWHQKIILLLFAVFAVQRTYTWVQTVTRAEAADRPAASQPVAPQASGDALDVAIADMREGLTELRQAATTGEPAMLQEAEKDILTGLLDALDASVIGSPRKLDPRRYQRVVDAVAEVEGMFKYIPYRLEVRPEGGLPPIELMLRRSPWPVIQARTGSAWSAAMVEGGVRLTPKASP